MQQQQLDQVTNWISKCETFDRWIDGESEQLKELLTFSEEDASLDKVLEEEQAIRVRERLNLIIDQKLYYLRIFISGSDALDFDPLSLCFWFKCKVHTN